MAAMADKPDGKWEVPYLPIDPTDIGCNYEAVIRVNSQSGKGGCAWILERELGITLPKPVQQETDRTSKEILPDDLCRLFADTYLVPSRYSSMGSTSVPGEGTIGSITLKSLDVNSANGMPCALKANLAIEGKSKELSGSGDGLETAFASVLSQAGYKIKTKAFTQSAQLPKEPNGKSPGTVTSVLVERDYLFCVCSVKHNDKHAKLTSCQTKQIKDLNP